MSELFDSRGLSENCNPSIRSLYSHEQSDEDVEKRVDAWLNSRGIYPDDPSAKKTSYFSAKRSKVSSVIFGSACNRFISREAFDSTDERNFFFCGQVPESKVERMGLKLELESPLLIRTNSVRFTATIPGDEGNIRSGKSPRMRTGSMRGTFTPEPTTSSLFARRMGNKSNAFQLELQESEIFGAEPEAPHFLTRSSVGGF
jgi:hypothetical protein